MEEVGCQHLVLWLDGWWLSQLSGYRKHHMRLPLGQRQVGMSSLWFPCVSSVSVLVSVHPYTNQCSSSSCALHASHHTVQLPCPSVPPPRLVLQDAQMQVGLMRTLDVWLSEDHSRVENRLCQREAVGQLVEVYSRLCRNMASVRSPVMPQMLESLKVMLDRCVDTLHACSVGYCDFPYHSVL